MTLVADTSECEFDELDEDDGSAPEEQRVAADPLKGSWYPLVPRCVHCGQTKYARSAHPAGLCKLCNGTSSLRQRYYSEALPPALTPRSWVFFQRDPQLWLARLCGRSHVNGVPSQARPHEPHRVMHILCARHHGAEEVELTWDAINGLVHEQREQVYEDSLQGLDAFQPEEDSTVSIETRERMNRHVRIWRSKFNTQVARPLCTWLRSAGVALGEGGIERTNKTLHAGGWELALVVGQLIQAKYTPWSLVFMRGEVSLICSGMGLTLPDDIVLVFNTGDDVKIASAGEGTDPVPFDHATLAQLLLGA